MKPLLPAVVMALLASTALAQPNRPLRQVIDDEVRTAWQREKVTPSPRATDAEFCRRLHLDLVGVVPEFAEVRKFLDDPDPKKRDKLIDRLLTDPRFAANQASVWDLVLFGRNPSFEDAIRRRVGFKKWLGEQFAKNEPYDRWVSKVMLAEEEGTEFFHAQFRYRPEDAAVAVSRIFLGTQLQCARCHDHPFENWTQKDFYGLAGFFVRIIVPDPTGSGDKARYRVGEKSTGEVLFTGAAREQKPGQKGEPIKPKFLGGPALEEPPLPKDFKEPDLRTAKTFPKPLFSRKEKLAAWLTAADNPWFARAAVNRVWSQFMGRGLVHPIDDLSEKNLPSHPELLRTLTEQFVRSKFDMKTLIREIVSSETYQLASTGPGIEAMPRWFERARVRPLTAEEMLASIRVATGSVDLKGGYGDEYFRLYFGEPTNGQGEFQGGLAEHLFLNNGDQVRQMIYRRKGNLADTLLTSKEPWEKRVDVLFLSVLGRPPKEPERKRFVEYLNVPKPEAPVEEAIWVLLNTAEFRFNH